MQDESKLIAADELIVSAQTWHEMEAHLRNALPNEGVGLLGCSMIESYGTWVARAEAFYPGQNAKASPSRYEMDTPGLVRALRDIDEHGWVLGAIAHSHPNGARTPSETDLREAYYPESLMVIFSFATIPPAARAWRLEREHGSWRAIEAPIWIDE